MWQSTEKNSFGLAEIKREGQKLGPVSYLRLNGRWPTRDFYSDTEYKQVQQDGWEFVETIESEGD